VPGVVVGLLMGMIRPVREAVEPYVAFLFPVPKIALLPFLLILLGVGEPAFVLTGALSAFFQITIRMVGYVRAVRDLAADGGRGWTEDRNVDIIVKYTGAKREVIKRARPHVVDPNLELDPRLLDSMQKLNADLGYLKYTEFLSADKLFTFTYVDRALRELGRR
jgi:hypothetical protein